VFVFIIKVVSSSRLSCKWNKPYPKVVLCNILLHISTIMI